MVSSNFLRESKKSNAAPPILIGCPTSLILNHKSYSLQQFCETRPSFSAFFLSTPKWNILFWLREKQFHSSSHFGKKKSKHFSIYSIHFFQLGFIRQWGGKRQHWFVCPYLILLTGIYFLPHRTRKQNIYLFIYSEQEQGWKSTHSKNSWLDKESYIYFLTGRTV